MKPIQLFTPTKPAVHPRDLTMLILFIAGLQNAWAETNHFADSKESIIKQLTVPKTNQLPDTLDDLSLEILSGADSTRGQSNKLNQLANQGIDERRGLARVTVPDNIKTATDQTMQQEFVPLPEQQAQPHVNLKIEFDPDSYAIRANSFQLLQELGQALNSEQLKQQTFYINGHTDADGDAQYNLKLSLNRALSVKYYLQAHFAIADDRLKVMGYGEGLPLKANTSSANKQLNRRVEIVVR